MESSRSSGGSQRHAGSSSSSGIGSPGPGAFIYLGFLGVLGFSGLHLAFCLITSWVLGWDFSTVVYITAATLVSGTLITFTFAFLVLINVVITAFSNFSNFGQNLMGGAGGGGGGGGGLFGADFDTNPRSRRSSPPQQQSYAEDYDPSSMKLD